MSEMEIPTEGLLVKRFSSKAFKIIETIKQNSSLSTLQFIKYEKCDDIDGDEWREVNWREKGISTALKSVMVLMAVNGEWVKLRGKASLRGEGLRPGLLTELIRCEEDAPSQNIAHQ